MSASEWFTNVASQIVQGLNAAHREAFDAVVQEVGMEDVDAGFVQVAHAYKPVSLTPKDFVVRSPYANPKAYKTNMAASAERGWLKVVDKGQYTVSNKGAEVVGRLLGTLNEGLAGIEALPEADLERVHDLLQKVVDKTYELPEPAEKRGLEWGKRFQKAFVVEGAPTLVRVRRRILDLLAFRDDGHVAAWKALEKDGQIWEALTYVWRGEAGDAAELVEKLPYRNYDEESYAAALGELIERGWIAQENGKHVITDKGKELRQGAEDATNRYFDAPWSVLSEAETKELQGLLGRLAEAVKLPEEE
jgi:hypothetical protein